MAIRTTDVVSYTQPSSAFPSIFSRHIAVRMHNGQISSFSKLKRKLLAALPEPLFLFPQGHTDSEYAFAVFLSHLQAPESQAPFDHREMRQAMLATIADFNRWAKEAGVEEVSPLSDAGERVTTD